MVVVVVGEGVGVGDDGTFTTVKSRLILCLELIDE